MLAAAFGGAAERVSSGVAGASGSAKPVELVRRAPAPPTPTPLPTPRPQLDLFDAGAKAATLPIPKDVLAKLSSDERVFLVLLKENGSLKTSEVATRMNKAPPRVNGMLVQLRKRLHAAGIELFTSETLPSGETLYRYQGGQS